MYSEMKIAVQLFVSLFVLLPDAVFSICPGDNYTETKDVRFGLMTAADNRLRFVSVGCIPAIELAVDLINNDTSLLNGYRLTHNPYIDTGCDRRSAYDRFFDFIESDMPPSIAIIGAGCSTASEPVAEIAPFWNVPVIAYVSASPLLSNRLRYPNFYRTYISDQLVAPAFVALTKSFGWKQLLIISENEPVFVENIRTQFNLLEEAGIRVSSRSFMFNTDQLEESSLETAIQGNDHVFFINTFENAARDILCFFYRKGYRYPAFAFMTHAWFAERWFFRNTTGRCTPEQVASQLHRVVTFVPFLKNEDVSLPTFSGLSTKSFENLYRKRLAQANLTYQLEAFDAFDAVYAMAIALDKVQKAVCNGSNLGCEFSENLTSIEDFEYYNAQVECMLKTELSNTDFLGVSGPVMFDENGTRIIGTFEIRQYQLNNTQDCPGIGLTEPCHASIGAVDIENQTFRFIGRHNNQTVWPEGIPPDGQPIELTNTLETPLIVVIDIFAVAGIVFAVVCLIFNIVFRNKRIVKLTSPNLNYVIIAGAFFSYISIILRMLPGTDTLSLVFRCQISYVFSIFGYTLAFSAVLAKMWRVFYIFHNPTTKKRSLKDWHLLLLVATLSGTVVLLLLIGESVPILRQTAERVNDEEHSDTTNEFEVVIEHYIYTCSTEVASIVYEGIVFGYLFILQLVAVILAFQTRKVKIKALNDAKQVIAIIYTTTVCLIVLILTAFALGRFLNATSALYSSMVWIATTIFLSLIFIPKMISLYQDPEGKNVFSTSQSNSNTPAGGVVGVASGSGSLGRKSGGRLPSVAQLSVSGGVGLEDSKTVIEKLENRVSQLKDELERYDVQTTPQTNGTKKVSIVSFKDDRIVSSSPAHQHSNGGGRKQSHISNASSCSSLDTPTHSSSLKSALKSNGRSNDTLTTSLDTPTTPMGKIIGKSNEELQNINE